MTIREIAERTRTVRRFQENRPIDAQLLEGLVDLARLGGSASNRQPLKFMIVTEPELCREIFPHLGWAGYLTDWPGPQEGERPAAYIFCLLDEEINQGAEKFAYCDLGIATQNLLLGAAELGIFGCRIASFSSRVESILHLSKQFSLILVVALGYPAEKVVLEQVGSDGDIRYWRDTEGVHHVPKRAMADILLHRDPAAEG